MLELGRLLVDPVFRAQSGVPRGNGRPVVLLPGFLAGNQTLAVMAGWLRRLGMRRACAGSSPTSTAPTGRSSASTR